MRRQLIVTVAAVVSMVLLAMLVPTAVLVREYALEDKLARAALEVQATETVVSGAGQDYGDVSLYLDAVNASDDGIQTTVLYPGGPGVGPTRGRTPGWPRPGGPDRPGSTTSRTASRCWCPSPSGAAAASQATPP